MINFKWIKNIIGNPISIERIGPRISFRNSFLIKTTKQCFLLKYYTDPKKMDRSIYCTNYVKNNSNIISPAIIACNRELNLILFEFLDGRSLSDILGDKNNNSIMVNIVQEFGKVVNELHHLDYKKIYNLPTINLKTNLNLEYNKLSILINIIHNVLNKLKNDSVDAYKNKTESQINKLINNVEPFIKKRNRFFSNNAFIHGDLWSKNVLIKSGSKIEIGLLDFEWSCIGDPVLDIARVYSRGLVSLNVRKKYQITAPTHLWDAFCFGYGDGDKINMYSLPFIRSFIFTHIRTLNYYGTQINLTRNASKNLHALKTIFRITSALNEYFLQYGITA